MNLFSLNAFTVFLAIGALGFLFLMVSLVFGEIFEHLDSSLDHDLDHGGPGFFSTRVMSVFVTAFGGFLVGQEATRRMLPNKHGAILFTGASASVKGYALSAPFAMGKFALRGLAQSMARELAPKNIHVAHFVIDGGIKAGNDARAAERGEDGMLLPDEIARSYLAVYRQHRSAWSWELELRPWLEKF